MRKTYYCQNCDEEFTGLISVHRKCGLLCAAATRKRLVEIIESGHPPGIRSAKTARINKMVEKEFEARGISNYTNQGGTPKITYAGSYGGTSVHGHYQPPIQAGWTKRDSVMQMSPVHQLYGVDAPNFGSGPTAPPSQPAPANTIPWSKMVPQGRVE